MATDVYSYINALSKAVYETWEDKASFDFVSFAQDNKEVPFRITWSLASPTIQSTIQGGEYYRSRFSFTLQRNLHQNESNLYQFLNDQNTFFAMLRNRNFDIVTIGALETATPDRVQVTIEAVK